MRTLALASALLASTALYMMPDAASGGDSQAPAKLSTIDALNALSPDNDSHWTADGLPDVDAMEALTGNKWLSRGDLEGFPIDRETARAKAAAGVPLIPSVPEPVLDPAPAAPPVPPDPATPSTGSGDATTAPADGVTLPPPVEPEVPPSPPAVISICRLVLLTFDASAPFDGDTSAVGLVVKVNDDGSANVKAFAPGGGADGFFTGVRNTDDVLAMPDGAEKNAALACTWSFPPRV